MSSLIIRPACPKDRDALLTVAKQAGSGMTTVPQTGEAIEARIEASVRAFAGTGKATTSDIFFFVLDDGTGAVGMASIFPNLGEDRPFYSYRLSKIATHAPEIGMRASTDVLYLANDFHGYTEVGTLLVGEAARGLGAGRFLSLSRFMYMGTHRERFGANVMAEIRGWFDDVGNSPFWDNIAAKFFDTTFAEADRLSAHDFRFISHLMPKFPIYVSLLAPEAREVIGKPHPTSSHAMSLLTNEGFAWSRCIDIFDGGPSLECPIDRIRTVSKSQTRGLTIAETAHHIADAEPFIVSSLPPANFVVAIGSGHREGKTVVVTPEIAERAGLRNGAQVNTAPLKG